MSPLLSEHLWEFKKGCSGSFLCSECGGTRGRTPTPESFPGRMSALRLWQHVQNRMNLVFTGPIAAVGGWLVEVFA